MKDSHEKNMSSLLGNCTICSIFIVLSLLAILAMVNYPPDSF